MRLEDMLKGYYRWRRSEDQGLNPGQMQSQGAEVASVKRGSDLQEFVVLSEPLKMYVMKNWRVTHGCKKPPHDNLGSTTVNAVGGKKGSDVMTQGCCRRLPGKEGKLCLGKVALQAQSQLQCIWEVPLAQRYAQRNVGGLVNPVEKFPPCPLPPS